MPRNQRSNHEVEKKAMLKQVVNTRYQDKKHSEHKESGKNHSVDQKRIRNTQETARNQETVMEKIKDANKAAIKKTRKR